MNGKYLKAEPIVLSCSRGSSRRTVYGLRFKARPEHFLSKLFSVNMMSKTSVHINKHERQFPIKLTNQKEVDRDITRHYRTEKQYCLKDNNWIVDISEWVGDNDD
jgi:hypothetical protein